MLITLSSVSAIFFVLMIIYIIFTSVYWFDYLLDKNVLDCVSSLLKQGAYKNLIDYDNHLDDITLDWTNSIINDQVDQLMDMYE